MAEDGDSLLREVQEELRREQLRKIWDNYNGLIIGGAVFLLYSRRDISWLLPSEPLGI